MVLWRGNGLWKKKYVIVYIMFSKNNTIEFETFYSDRNTLWLIFYRLVFTSIRLKSLEIYGTLERKRAKEKKVCNCLYNVFKK